MKGSGDGSDVRRLDRQQRYKAPVQTSQAGPEDDLTTEYMNVLGMIFSMCGIMLKLKWCAWVALYCSCVSFANSRINDNTKQIFSSFMLSIMAVIMCYLQNPQPMSPPWAAGRQHGLFCAEDEAQRKNEKQSLGTISSVTEDGSKSLQSLING